MQPGIATNTELMRGLPAEKVPRFDKMILAAQDFNRSKSSTAPRPRGHNIKMHAHLEELLKGKTEMERNYPSMINTK